jgi:hypothetical protein
VVRPRGVVGDGWVVCLTRPWSRVGYVDHIVLWNVHKGLSGLGGLCRSGVSDETLHFTDIVVVRVHILLWDHIYFGIGWS